ncbi:MAG: acetylornithine and succinylornithine aminotransferase [Solirubrobacterales bacterium]|nr:acetylornithine and succinylornithine aminotransferase [Solirubrobacterales bacterium]
MSAAALQAVEAAHVVPNYARQPVAFVRGAGSRLWDDEGHEYLDFLTGIGVLNVGHCHPRVVAAIREQAGTLLHVSNLFYTEPAMRLAERLAERSLGGKVMFSNSGAEAIEGALKLARKNRRGGEIVTVHGGFHGRTYGALSATPQESKQAPFAPLVPGFVAVPPTAEALDAAIGEQTAAVVLEVVQGESGVHPLPLDALRAARAACDEHGAALVFDEIQTGMGRTGSLFAYEQIGVVPDAMTLAKSLGGGLPIGALVTGPALADVFQPGDHGSTFAGGPTVAAAANAALDVLDDPELLARVGELGARLAAALRDVPGIAEVRQRGLMVGFDLDAGGAPALARRALLEQRLVLNATGPDTVRMLPALVVTEAECDDALARLTALLR